MSHPASEEIRGIEFEDFCPYTRLEPDGKSIFLDGTFTIFELEQLVFLMKRWLAKQP